MQARWSSLEPLTSLDMLEDNRKCSMFPLGRMWTFREKLHPRTYASQRFPLVSLLVANAVRRVGSSGRRAAVCGGVLRSSREVNDYGEQGEDLWPRNSALHFAGAL